MTSREEWELMWQLSSLALAGPSRRALSYTRLLWGQPSRLLGRTLARSLGGVYTDATKGVGRTLTRLSEGILRALVQVGRSWGRMRG